MTPSFKNHPWIWVLFILIALIWGVESISAQPDVVVLAIDTTLDTNEGAYQVCSAAPGDCSLRGAISKVNADAADAYQIQIPAGTYTLTLPGADDNENLSGDLDVLRAVDIQGAGAGQTILQAGSTPGTGIDRVFHFADVTDMTVSDLTVQNGYAAGTGGGGILVTTGNFWVTLERVVVRSNVAAADYSGGGILAQGYVRLADSTVSDNVGYEGGGLYMPNFGQVEILRSTVNNNQARYYGGGLAINGVMTVTNSTISGNQAGEGGGGFTMWNLGQAWFVNTTVASNTLTNTLGTSWAGYNPRELHVINTILAAPAGKRACSQSVTTSLNSLATDGNCGANILNSDPYLAPLQDNGGLTPTHALLRGSPALDAGDNLSCPLTDQRGFTRPLDFDGNGLSVCDIGAYERFAETFIPLLFR